MRITNDKQLIENIIDAKGLTKTLELIIDVCYEKSTHISENWQDVKTAREWLNYALQMEKAIASLDVNK